MKVYTIFDDFDLDAAYVLDKAGCELTIHPSGVPRPDPVQMKKILEDHDCVIIGTTQKITEDMFERIDTPRVIATASVGLDHIHIPEEKQALVTILNTPTANAQSVAEYTMGCALSCCKRLAEGNSLYHHGRNNKQLSRKPEDLSGKTIGVVGAGNISRRIMEYAGFFGMTVLCWTKNPDRHRDLESRGVTFVSLDTLLQTADVVSVNLPNNAGTKNLISRDRIAQMKENGIFISVSRLETVDAYALFEKAAAHPTFYVCLDLDVDDSVVAAAPDSPNVIITPHIAGGTVETRKRMFRELAAQIEKLIGE